MAKATLQGDRLKQCREHYKCEDGSIGLRQEDLAKEIAKMQPKEQKKKCSRQQVSAIESGSREMSLEYADYFGRFFHVLPDYLLGRIDYRSEGEKRSKELNDARESVHAVDILLGCAGYVIKYEDFWQVDAKPSGYIYRPRRKSPDELEEELAEKVPDGPRFTVDGLAEKVEKRRPGYKVKPESIRLTERIPVFDPEVDPNEIYYPVEKSVITVGTITRTQLDALADKVKDYCLFELEHMVDLRQPEKANNEEDD